MGPATAEDRAHIEVLADVVESSVCSEEIARDPISAGRAVLWLQCTQSDCAASSALIKEGIARVSMAQEQPTSGGITRASGGDGGGGGGGSGDGGGTSRIWLPTIVRTFPAANSRGQQRRRQNDDTSRRRSTSCLSSARLTTAAALVADDNGERRGGVHHHCCSAFISPCLAEALGLADRASSSTSTRLHPAAIRLAVRELPGLQFIPHASNIELTGPYPVATGPSGKIGDDGEGSPPPLPASVVKAVTSILPCALDGEVLSRGSVVRVAGLYGFVVAGVQTGPGKKGGVEEEARLVTSTGGKGGVVVRVNCTTKVRLLLPTRSRHVGVVEGSVSAAAAAAAGGDGGATTISDCHSPPTNVRDHFNNSATAEPLPAIGQQQGNADTGSKRCVALLPPQISASTTSAYGPTTPSPAPAYMSCDCRVWISRVEQDFGGLRNQVTAVVATVGVTLRGNGGGGGGDGSGLNLPASGLLLHGPTGVGKTLLARSVAQHSGAPWFFLDCASVFRRDRGEAEQYVQDFLTKAGACAPSIVVLDQVESVCRRRPEAAGITELQVFSVVLETMERFRRAACGSRVFFLATCFDSTTLDPSLLQRGRLEAVIRLGSLDGAARASVLAIHAKGMHLRLPFEQSAAVAAAKLGSSFLSTTSDGFKPCESKGGAASKDTDAAKPAEASATEEVLLLAGRRGDAQLSSADENTEADNAPVGMTALRGAEETPSSKQRARDEFLRCVAARCHGFLGSDLERLCREAAMHHMTAVTATAHNAVAAGLGPGRMPVRGGMVTKTAARDPGFQDLEGRGEQGTERAANAVRVDVGVGGGVRLQDFWAALDVVRPASLVGHSVGIWGGDGVPEGPCSPLVGCDAAMAELRAFLLTPLANPSLLRSLGLRPATGALLHGPPGCGKTSVARAIAAEGRGVANFLEVRCSDLVDKVVGRSERAVSDLFTAARAAAPCVLFLDQVEGVAARRGYHSSAEQTFDRILSTLLVEMDGVMSESGGHVVVLAATNDIARLDPALLRPGRLDRRVYLGSPDVAARTAIFLQRLLGMPLLMEDAGDHVVGNRSSADAGDRDATLSEGGSMLAQRDDHTRVTEGGEAELPRRRRRVLDSAEAYAEWLAGETEGSSGAQVTGVCREAALAALREGIGAAEVAPRHFEVALRGQRRRAAVVEAGLEGF